MLVFLRGGLVFSVVLLNTVIHVPILLVVALCKFLLPLPYLREPLSRFLIVLAESWVAVNSALITAATPTRFEIEGDQLWSHDGWYLVISNHQSWVDIPVLQKLFNRRIPFLKFFLKRELIWVPLLGLAWWALDFPFMRRYSQAFLAKHPELRGKDKDITRHACARFKHEPVCVMNFVEGTRFTPQKQAAQMSEFAHLLRPKAGGVGFVLSAMDGLLTSMLDVSIAYPAGIPTMWQLFSGGIPVVRIHIRQRDIPAEMIGDYENDANFRARFQAWINGIWTEKDAVIAQMVARG